MSLEVKPSSAPPHMQTHDPRPWALLNACFADPEVDEVLVNGADSVFVERSGILYRLGAGWSEGEIERVVQYAIAPLGLSFDRAHPIVDARLPDGSRLHGVAAPVAIDGPYLSVRRFRTRSLSLVDFGFDQAAATHVEDAVRNGATILVSGGTSTGKTSLLNVLASFIPTAERIVSIEENAELRLRSPHVVRLEARPANADGIGAVPVRELVRAALRMRPDRLIVGEVRGGEAYDLVQALNTGHAGMMTTVHANSPEMAIDRLVDLAAQARVGVPMNRGRVARSVSLVVQLERVGGRRRVAAVCAPDHGGSE
ncbi:MAG: ATPase, T2SS/T4P/T4SS family [Acidimicrobiia bacterium]